MSGVVTDTDLPDAKGTRAGITVHDPGRRDRLGHSWASTGIPVETKTCRVHRVEQDAVVEEHVAVQRARQPPDSGAGARVGTGRTRR